MASGDFSLPVLAHDASEEVVKAWDSRQWGCGLSGRFVSSFLLSGSGLVSSSSSRLSVAQATVVIILRVAVRVRQDYAILVGFRGLNTRGSDKLTAGRVEWMAEGLGRSLDVSFGLIFHRGAVFVIVHVAVVALLGLATDAEPVADLVD